MLTHVHIEKYLDIKAGLWAKWAVLRSLWSKAECETCHGYFHQRWEDSSCKHSEWRRGTESCGSLFPVDFSVYVLSITFGLFWTRGREWWRCCHCKVKASHPCLCSKLPHTFITRTQFSEGLIPEKASWSQLKIYFCNSTELSKSFSFSIYYCSRLVFKSL